MTFSNKDWDYFVAYELESGKEQVVASSYNLNILGDILGYKRHKQGFSNMQNILCNSRRGKKVNVCDSRGRRVEVYAFRNDFTESQKIS